MVTDRPGGSAGGWAAILQGIIASGRRRLSGAIRPNLTRTRQQQPRLTRDGRLPTSFARRQACWRAEGLLRELHCPARLHSGQKSSSCRWPSELLSHPAGLGGLSTTRHCNCPPARLAARAQRAERHKGGRTSATASTAAHHGSTQPRPPDVVADSSQSKHVVGGSGHGGPGSGAAKSSNSCPTREASSHRPRYYVCEPAPRRCSVGLCSQLGVVVEQPSVQKVQGCNFGIET
ncbi:hypothetical protein IQ07DRAFT_593781 [Pyrenochaeta sp. DS3sAY3a]|nr:hypothetical protein IQ07DRAFT_593781 [Pyrenochaeta sp. DS3sAY3a]